MRNTPCKQTDRQTHAYMHEHTQHNTHTHTHIHTHTHTHTHKGSSFKREREKKKKKEKNNSNQCPDGLKLVNAKHKPLMNVKGRSLSSDSPAVYPFMRWHQS